MNNAAGAEPKLPPDGTIVQALPFADLPPDGTIVRARPFGWDEVLTPEQFMDMTPIPAEETAGILIGPIEVGRGVGYGGRPALAVLVNGREADPKTVEVVREPNRGPS